MSPRKSSTSSAKRFDRPRYLGVEVAGGSSLSVRGLQEILRREFASVSPVPVSVRVIRSIGRRAIVEIPHRAVGPARAAWNRSVPGGGGATIELRTRKTWGTLTKGKLWVRRPAPPRAP